MTRAALFAALGLALASCSGSNTSTNNATAEAAIVSVQAPEPSASAPPASASAKVRTTTEPLPLPMPENTVCELSAASWTRAPALRLKPDGPSFATVHRLKDAHVFVPKDPAAKGILLRGSSGPVELTALALASELPVYAQAEPLLAGVFVPAGSTPLRFSNADVGVVKLTMPVPPIELTALAGPLDAAMTCKDVSLDWGSGDITKTFKTHEAGLLVGETIPLSAEVKGRTVTTLVPPGDLREVTVLEKAPTAVRIAWQLKDGWVIGWVPSSAVKPGKPRPGSGYGSGGGTGPVRVKRPAETRSCDHDLSLGVEHEGTSAIIGRINAKAKLDLYEDDGERVALSVQGADIRLSEGARLFVRLRDIKSCPIIPAEPAK